MMKNLRKNKSGISLIVLVITIIVMIILATAIILSLSNSGIIGKANSAVQANNVAQIKERVELLQMDEMINEDGGLKKVIKQLKSEGLIDNMEILDGDYIPVPPNKIDEIADNEKVVYLKYGDQYIEIATGDVERGKYNSTNVSFNMTAEISETQEFNIDTKATTALNKMYTYSGQGTLQDIMNSCDSFKRLKDRYSDDISSNYVENNLSLNNVAKKTTKYSFAKLSNSSTDMAVNLNDGRPLIQEYEFIFAWHNMRVVKDLFVENDSIKEAYYKLYLENIEGKAADGFEITVLSGDEVLYNGLLSDFTREKSNCIGKLKIGQKNDLRIEFKFIGYIEYQEDK